MIGLRSAAAALRAVGEIVHAEWNDAEAARFQRETIGGLVAASLSLAHTEESVRDEISRARRDL